MLQDKITKYLHRVERLMYNRYLNCIDLKPNNILVNDNDQVSITAL